MVWYGMVLGSNAISSGVLSRRCRAEECSTLSVDILNSNAQLYSVTYEQHPHGHSLCKFGRSSILSLLCWSVFSFTPYSDVIHISFHFEHIIILFVKVHVKLGIVSILVHADAMTLSNEASTIQISNQDMPSPRMVTPHEAATHLLGMFHVFHLITSQWST